MDHMQYNNEEMRSKILLHTDADTCSSHNRQVVQVESLQNLSKELNSFWRLRRLDPIANYVVEVSVPTIILFCVIYNDVDDLYKWKTFQPRGLHQSHISHADVKSGSNEGL